MKDCTGTGFETKTKGNSEITCKRPIPNLNCTTNLEPPLQKHCFHVVQGPRTGQKVVSRQSFSSKSAIYCWASLAFNHHLWSYFYLKCHHFVVNKKLHISSWSKLSILLVKVTRIGIVLTWGQHNFSCAFCHLLSIIVSCGLCGPACVMSLLAQYEIPLKELQTPVTEVTLFNWFSLHSCVFSSFSCWP